MRDNPAIQVVSLLVEVKDVAEVEDRNCIQVVNDH